MKERSVHLIIERNGKRERRLQGTERKGIFGRMNSLASRKQSNTKLILKRFWLRQPKRRKMLQRRQAKSLLFSNLKFRGRSSLQTEPSQLPHLCQLHQVKSNSRMPWDLSFEAKISPNEVTIQFRICIPNNTLQV